MNNNIVVKLLQLKQSFLQSAEKQNELLVNLSNISTSVGSIVGQTIVLSNGKQFSISSQVINGVKKIAFTNVIDTSDPDPQSITEYVDIDSSGGVSLDAKVEFLQDNVYNILNDIRETDQVNSAIAGLCSLYSTKSSRQVDELINYLDTMSINSSDSITELKQMLIVNADNGSISQYKLMTIIKGVFESGKDSVEQGSLIMNQSSPYFIKNAIGTILSEVFSILTSVLSAVLAAVNVVLSMVVSVIVKIISRVSDALASAVRTGIKVNTEAGLNIFDAPIYCLADDGLWNGGYSKINGLVSTKAKVYSYGPLLAYFWSTKGSSNLHPDWYTGYISNGFLSINLHPERTVEWLTNNYLYLTATGYSPSNSCSCLTPHDRVEFPDSVYLTSDEIISLQFADSETLLKYAYFNICCLSLISLKPGTLRVNNYNLQDRWQRLAPSTSGHDGTNYDFARLDLLKDLLHACACYNVNSSLSTWYSNLNLVSLGTDMTTIAILIQKGESYYLNKRQYTESLGAHLFKTWSSDNGTIAFTSFISLVSGMVVSSTSNLDIWCTLDCEASSIPTTGMFSFANTTWQEVVAAAAIIGVVLLATITVTTIGIVALKRYSTKKQLGLYAECTAARNRYIDTDTGEIIGGKQEYNALRKASKKYNRWGRLLGFGTYDPTNNWCNGPDSSISVDVPDNPSSTTVEDICGSDMVTLSSLQTGLSTSIEDIPSTIVEDICGSDSITLSSLQTGLSTSMEDIYFTITGQHH